MDIPCVLDDNAFFRSSQHIYIYIHTIIVLKTYSGWPRWAVVARRCAACATLRGRCVDDARDVGRDVARRCANVARVARESFR